MTKKKVKRLKRGEEKGHNIDPYLFKYTPIAHEDG
jgi:hypothetical protein